MPQKTDIELQTEADVIGDETTPLANTADRVRDMLTDLIDSKVNNEDLSDSGVNSVSGDGVDNTDPANPVVSFPTTTDLGLQNVDNTSDADKPISDATQTALNLKADASELAEKLDAANNLSDVGNAATALQNLGGLEKSLTLNTQTGDYTLVLGDFSANSLIIMNKATGQNLTVPTNASVAVPIGRTVYVVRIGVGRTTFVASGGVTISSSSGTLTDTDEQNVIMSLTKTGTNTWLLQNGIATPSQEWTRIMLTATATTSSTALSDVTELSFAVASGVKYEYEFHLWYKPENVSTGGAYFSINGPASPTESVIEIVNGLTATGVGYKTFTAFDGGAVFATSAAVAGTPCTIKGIVKPSASGTMVLRYASETTDIDIALMVGYCYVIYRVLP